MAEYIYAVTGAVLVSEMCMMLMPEGAIKRFAKTAVGVLLMLMMLIPLKDCQKKEFSVWKGTEAENPAYKTTYSDIIMDIYERTMENAEEDHDGKETADS